jgi:hypothetical protein
MTQMQQVGQLLLEGQFKKALSFAKNWKMKLTKEQQSQIRRGYECYGNPDFYRQLGFDPEAEKLKAVRVLQKAFDFRQVIS